jgi:predicted ester cyclase
MPSETTATTMRAYLDALLARGDFAAFLADEATFELMGTPQTLYGRDAVRDMIVWLHTLAFDARPKVRALVTGDDQAVLEAGFVGTHTGEFAGTAATGRSVDVPYCVVYDLQGDKITALRCYMPMELLAQQVKGSD